MPRMPFEQLDALIVEEFGKDVSGSGLDPFVTGRTDIRGIENPKKPFIHKIVFGKKYFCHFAKKRKIK